MSRTAITLIEKSLGYLTVNDEIELERKRHAAAHGFRGLHQINRMPLTGGLLM